MVSQHFQKKTDFLYFVGFDLKNSFFLRDFSSSNGNHTVNSAAGILCPRVVVRTLEGSADVQSQSLGLEVLPFCASVSSARILG